MQVDKIKAPKLADVIEAQLEQMVLDGTLKPGQKLPPERELAQQFDVSRPSLREAILRLETKGLLRRKQGGGNYVQERLQDSLSDPLLELLASTPSVQGDLLEFRMGLEELSAFYAAKRGDEVDLTGLREKLDWVDSLGNQDLDAMAEGLTDFYVGIMQASHNRVLMHLVQGLSLLLKRNIRFNLEQLSRQPDRLKRLQKFRRELLAAIEQRQPEQAQAISREQLNYIRDAITS